VEVARLEHNGTLFHSAQPGICSRQAPRLNRLSNPYLFPANPCTASPFSPSSATGEPPSCFVALPLILAGVLQASTDPCAVQTESVPSISEADGGGGG
jgi:hypothetical protein